MNWLRARFGDMRALLSGDMRALLSTAGRIIARSSLSDACRSDTAMARNAQEMYGVYRIRTTSGRMAI
jgi:hypothetical protein